MNFNWKYKRCTTYMEKPKERKRFLQHSKRWDMLNISEKIVLAIWQSAHSTLSRFIYCSKISLEPGKEPEETHSLLHRALSISWSYWQYLDVDWNESEKLFRINGNLNWQPEFYVTLIYDGSPTINSVNVTSSSLSSNSIWNLISERTCLDILVRTKAANVGT